MAVIKLGAWHVAPEACLPRKVRKIHGCNDPFFKGESIRFWVMPLLHLGLWSCNP